MIFSTVKSIILFIKKIFRVTFFTKLLQKSKKNAKKYIKLQNSKKKVKKASKKYIKSNFFNKKILFFIFCKNKNIINYHLDSLENNYKIDSKKDLEDDDKNKHNDKEEALFLFDYEIYCGGV